MRNDCEPALTDLLAMIYNFRFKIFVLFEFIQIYIYIRLESVNYLPEGVLWKCFLSCKKMKKWKKKRFSVYLRNSLEIKLIYSTYVVRLGHLLFFAILCAYLFLYDLLCAIFFSNFKHHYYNCLWKKKKRKLYWCKGNEEIRKKNKFNLNNE